MTATVEADARTGLHAALIKAVGEANVFTGEGIDDRYKVDAADVALRAGVPRPSGEHGRGRRGDAGGE